MFRSIHPLRRIGLLAVALLICPLAANAADAAGVVGFRNDTNQVISVQTVMVLPNGKTKSGKPQMLYPGEVAIDGLIGTGTRRITVTDPKKPNAPPLFEAEPPLSEDAFYSVQPETAINVKMSPPPMKMKLVAVPLPMTTPRLTPKTPQGIKPPASPMLPTNPAPKKP